MSRREVGEGGKAISFHRVVLFPSDKKLRSYETSLVTFLRCGMGDNRPLHEPTAGSYSRVMKLSSSYKNTRTFGRQVR